MKGDGEVYFTRMPEALKKRAEEERTQQMQLCKMKELLAVEAQPGMQLKGLDFASLLCQSLAGQLRGKLLNLSEPHVLTCTKMWVIL